jgi:hypothetical protein
MPGETIELTPAEVQAEREAEAPPVKPQVVLEQLSPGLVRARVGKLDLRLARADLPWLEAAAALLRGAR